MNDEEIKTAIVRKRWRVWYKPSIITINKWVVQRRTWSGRWKTVGSFWTETEAQSAKRVLIREDVETFRGNLSEIK